MFHRCAIIPAHPGRAAPGVNRVFETMELRQLRYFVRVVELGSMSRAALDLNLVQSALSQQITRLEGELATRLLHRTPRGVAPTEAGAAFFREAQLTLRHAEQAVRAAQQARLSGTVTVGLAPTTSTTVMLALGDALAVAMLERKGFSAEDFHLLHPGGKLGKRLLRVAHIMHGGDELPLATGETPMTEVLIAPERIITPTITTNQSHF